MLYSLYTAELAHIVARHGLLCYQYADDPQYYISMTVDDSAFAVDRLAMCQAYMDSRLRLNPTKTQVIWLGSRHSG